MNGRAVAEKRQLYNNVSYSYATLPVTFSSPFSVLPINFLSNKLCCEAPLHFLNLGTHALSQVSITPVQDINTTFLPHVLMPCYQILPFSWFTCGQSQVVLLCRRMVSPFFKSIRPFLKRAVLFLGLFVHRHSVPLIKLHFKYCRQIKWRVLIEGKMRYKAYVYFKL